MRRTCEEVVCGEPRELCGKPAVDCLRSGDSCELWLCAEHYDSAVRIEKILLESLNYVADKFRRGGYKRKGM